MDMPILAETVVQRNGVEGKSISREFETTWEGERRALKENCRGKKGVTCMAQLRSISF